MTEGSFPITEPYLSIVIPAYNEAQRLGPSLEKVVAFAAGLPQDVEVIVVDDGSTDETLSVAQELARKHRQLRVVGYRPNRGKGAAVRTGCLEAQGAVVFFVDADLPTPLEDLHSLIAALDGGADVAIGSRIQPDGTDMRASQNLYRRLLGKLYHALVRAFLVQGIADTQCGFKAFSHPAAQALFGAQKLSSIVFDTEILFLAQRWGLRIEQVPVRWTMVGGSRMRPTLRHGLSVLRDLLLIRPRHWRTRRPASLDASDSGSPAS